METSNREQSGIVRRIRPAGVTPLELWDLRVRDGILWDHMGHEDLGEVLREALCSLHAGGGETRSDGPAPACVAGFEGVYLTGGGASRLAPAFGGSPWPVWFAEEGQYAAEIGGNVLLAGRGLRGWVVDIGQSSLKISSGGKRWSFPRDYEAMPVRENRAEPVAAQREALREFVSTSLVSCFDAGAGMPEALVYALPSRLDDDGVPEGSSYIGMKDDAMLLPDVLARTGLAPEVVLVINDAELAAVSARVDGRVRGRVLVLTIGFGVGAALLET